MELQIRENEMADQVDKATFRALTAEKKLQEAGFESEIEKLQVRSYIHSAVEFKSAV